jgi:hypothetical protein
MSEVLICVPKFAIPTNLQRFWLAGYCCGTVVGDSTHIGVWGMIRLRPCPISCIFYYTHQAPKLREELSSLQGLEKYISLSDMKKQVRRILGSLGQVLFCHEFGNPKFLLR